MGLRAAFRLPSPDERVDQWHISPVVDLSAYSLSWLWVLAPLLLLGPARADYLFLYIFTIAITDLHRHFGLPYVYLDKQVRERYPARFWLFPLVLFGAFAMSPWLVESEMNFAPVDVAALAAGLIVLLQIIRRDGGEAAVPAAQLAWVLPAGVLGALMLTALGDSVPLGPAWWWLGAALFATSFFDYARLRRRARTRASEGQEPAEQAIASSGGPGFASSVLILALLGAALLVERWAEGAQVVVELPLASLLAGVGVFAALWNFWHVYMQKYGIMRMYNAKARGRFAELGEDQEVAGWVDRALVLCWLPLYFAYLGPVYREIAVDYFDDAAAVLPGFISLLERAMPVTLPLTIALVLVVHALWVRAEWRANRLRSVPRLAMAGGTGALALCFFAFDPVKVYLAFAFSHALEYCVFVWAFQRKRYHQNLTHQPLLGRLLRHPVVFYLGMILVFAVGIALLKFWGRSIFPGAERPELLGYRTAYWLGFWGIYQSMVHFYFDGFLWKMRLPSVRANI